MSDFSRPHQGAHGAYYPHIDGLRACAIIPVLLYHSWSSACPGGYAGVDVFFVISGYLITRGILQGLDRGEFTIAGFYHRRIRRILPAYFLIISCVFLAGCVLFHAAILSELGEATAMGTLFIGNVHSWLMQGNYFSHGRTSPLLHLWSLSVEEQFYIFIPLLCSIVYRRNPAFVRPVLGAIAVVSLLLAAREMNTGNQMRAFFLLPSRAWELLTGCVLATVANVTNGIADRRSAWIAGTGLLLIVIPYFAYGSTTPFPGIAAVPSVVGAAILIRYGQSGAVGHMLRSRPMVFTGKISYSLYLWHWPVIVFWTYVATDQINPVNSVGMIVVSVLLATVTWRCVETPVRVSTVLTARRSLVFAFAGILLLAAIGWSCVIGQGWHGLHPIANQWLAPEKFNFLDDILFRSRKVARISDLVGLEPRSRPRFFGDFHLGAPEKPTVLVMGDSQAGALFHGLDAYMRERGVAGRGKSVPGTEMFDLDNPECVSLLRVLEADKDLSKVLLVQYWEAYLARHEETELDSYYSKIEAFADRLRTLGKTLYIASDVYHWASDPGHTLAKLEMLSTHQVRDSLTQFQGIAVSSYMDSQGKINRHLIEICERTGSVFVPLHESLLVNGTFSAFDNRDGLPIPLYRDRHHLSCRVPIYLSEIVLI